MGFKERLYQKYTTHHARPNANMLASARPYYLRVISDCFPKNKDVRILDLGCGYGAFLSAMQECGYCNSAGVDISPEQVALAHELGIQNVSQGDIHAFLASLPDSSIDVICVIDVLEHMTGDELLNAGDAIFRVLKTDGICIVHVPNAAGIFGSVVSEGDLTHERAFTPLSMFQLCQAVGLKLDRIYEDSPVVHGFKSFVRAALWAVCTIPYRLIYLAELGVMPEALSQNMLCVLRKAA